MQTFDTFVEPYFASFVAIPKGEAALQPKWRQKDVAVVTGHLLLLESMKVLYRC